MKVKLQISKDGTTLVSQTSDIFDAGTFGRACGDAFAELRSRELDHSTSVGAMMDMLDMNVLEILDGATISLSKA